MKVSPLDGFLLILQIYSCFFFTFSLYNMLVVSTDWILLNKKKKNNNLVSSGAMFSSRVFHIILFRWVHVFRWIDRMYINVMYINYGLALIHVFLIVIEFLTIINIQYYRFLSRRVRVWISIMHIGNWNYKLFPIAEIITTTS